MDRLGINSSSALRAKRLEQQRPKATASFMDAALQEARRAAARAEVPVGAVVVRDGRLLASAGNRTRELNDPTAHAEMLAIRAACEAEGAERLIGADLYVTLEPCAMCAGAISFARIRRLYFGASDPKGGGVIHGGRFFTQPTCHHAPEVYEGLGEREAATLLKNFFAGKRE
uniref:tRNA-specific adenosine deaminase n=2 Tax=Phyllobacteriaceae TaxID=69277 RepID=Q11L94_CHESB